MELRMFILCALLLHFLGSAFAQVGPARFKACGSLKAKTNFHYKNLILYSPFYIYRTNSEALRCRTATFCGPAGNVTYYGSVNYVYDGTCNAYEIDTFQSGVMHSKQCETGEYADFKVVYYKQFNQHRAAFCAVACNANGVDYDMVICYGRYASDIVAIDKFLQNGRLKNVPNIFNAQENCDEPMKCQVFRQ